MLNIIDIVIVFFKSNQFIVQRTNISRVASNLENLETWKSQGIWNLPGKPGKVSEFHCLSGKMNNVTNLHYIHSMMVRMHFSWNPFCCNLSSSLFSQGSCTIHHEVPAYLSDMLTSVLDVDVLRRHRSADRADLIVPRTKTVRFDDWDFSVSGPRLWIMLCLLN